MATQVQLAIRTNEAYSAIAQATEALAARVGIDVVAPLSIRHRDPQIEQALRLESVAATLQAIDAALVATDSKPTASKSKSK